MVRNKFLGFVAALLFSLAAFPATDDFNRADSTTTLGGSWTDVGDGSHFCGIVSNEMSLNGFYAFTQCTYNGTYSNDQYSKAVYQFNTASYAYLYCRSTGTSTSAVWYGLEISPSGGDWKVVESPSYPTVVSGTDDFADGDTVELRCTGTTVAVYRNGVLLGSATDATVTAGNPGIGGYSQEVPPSVVWDNWEGGDVVTAGPYGARTDNFNRTDSTTTLGGSWTDVGDGSHLCGISSNEMSLNGSYAYTQCTHNGTFTDDQYVKAVYQFNTQSYAILSCRSTGTGGSTTRYSLAIDPSGGAWKVEEGPANTNILSGTDDFVNGDVAELRCIGTEISVYNDGVLLDAVTDSTITTGKPGIGGYSQEAPASVVWDDWEAGNWGVDTATLVQGNFSIFRR